MDSETLALLQGMIEEAVKPLRMAIEALSAEVEQTVKQVDEHSHSEDASADHYHDEYASADHVERSEGALNRRLYRIEEDARNLEYRISDVDRKAERAQSTAEDARRNSGSSRW
jgi:predicted ribosome quality control (RQC) complex YloA/Tae2 family protein